MRGDDDYRSNVTIKRGGPQHVGTGQRGTSLITVGKRVGLRHRCGEGLIQIAGHRVAEPCDGHPSTVSVGQPRNRKVLVGSRFALPGEDQRYATAARDARKISIGMGRRSRQVTAIGRLPSCLT
jgi:hypothetical protein